LPAARRKMRSALGKIVAWFVSRLGLAFASRKPKALLHRDASVATPGASSEVGQGSAEVRCPGPPIAPRDSPKSEEAGGSDPVAVPAGAEVAPASQLSSHVEAASPEKPVETAAVVGESILPESLRRVEGADERLALPDTAASLPTEPAERDGGDEHSLARTLPIVEEAPEDVATTNKREIKQSSAADEQPGVTPPPSLPEGKEAEPAGQPKAGAAAGVEGVATPAYATEVDWSGFSERPERLPHATNGPRVPRAAESVELGPLDDNEDSEEEVSSVSERKPPVPVDFSEYSGPGAGTFSDAYLYWNRILLAHFIRAAANGTIHVATSPRSLASAVVDELGERTPPAEAERRFCDAVACAYRDLAVGSAARLRVFRRRSADGTPLCIAFLSLSVLAAHKMHNDELASSNAYYSRLAHLLGVDLVKGFPADFRSSEFESLWLFVGDWISRNRGLALALPQGKPQKRYIAYPLAHVPLRQLDLEKLPAFFDWAGYSADVLPLPDRIEDDFRRWDQSYDSLSEAGKAAIGDNRLPAVIAQIRSELRAWDGLVADAQGMRYAQVEVLLETVARRSTLSLLAPRRQGFPQVFTSGPVQMSGGECWYDPLELAPEDGRLLLEGFSWPSEEEPRCVLRRPSGRVFALGPNSEYSGLISRLGLPKNTVCAVMCYESLSDLTARYLAEVCESPPQNTKDRCVPSGWVLFPNVRAVRRAVSVPPELRALNVASEVMIVPHGGLRLGSQWTWMQGAAPRLLVEGHDGEGVFVNGVAAALDGNGFIQDGGILSEPGIYTAKVGSLEKKVRIIQPLVRPSATDVGAAHASMMKSRHPAVLDVGDWVIVGSRPGETAHASVPCGRESLVFCEFEPAWAIKLGRRRRQTRIVRLGERAVDRGELITKKESVWAWASPICSAAIRRPPIEIAAGKNAAEAARSWGEYVGLARGLMSRGKRSR
jgi:hypothetical protein